MNIEDLRIGMKVLHPHHGLGTVKGINEMTADVQFSDLLRKVSPATSEMKPAEPQAQVSSLDMPLELLIRKVVSSMVEELDLEPAEFAMDQLAARWLKGKLILKPSDPGLQPKEVPLETFFHKIVMMRNNFRVLEQKINAHAQLNDAEKVEMQQYITKCYGSMTTFNILFKNESDQFRRLAEK